MPNVYVRRLVTNEIVHTVKVANCKRVIQVVAGLLHNLNTDKFYVDDSECDALEDPNLSTERANDDNL